MSRSDADTLEAPRTIVDEAPSVRPVALAAGSIIAHRYRIERFVNEGGTAQIFEATNLELDERVALKLAHPSLRASPELSARFRAEARALARIRSEHVARVFDVVSTDGGDPVMVMEFLEGEDLESIVQGKQLPPTVDLVGWFIEACSGLAIAHANGIVHRDVKPANLFIANMLGGGRVLKVLDFGISRLALSNQRKRAPSGAHPLMKLLGTPDYMAPEQILSSKAADPRIDVWGLGVVMYELFAGQRPFAGESVEKLCSRIIEADVVDVRTRQPDLDPQLAKIVHRCLQKDPNDRYPSVADLAVDLMAFGPRRHHSSVDQTVGVLKAAGLTTIDVPMVLSLAPTLDSSRSPTSSSRPTQPASAPPTPLVAPPAPPEPSLSPQEGSSISRAPAPERSRTTLLLAGLFLLLLVGFALYWTSNRHRIEPQAAAAQTSVSMRFETDPSGATVEIDGAVAGMSPASVALVPGRHLMTLSKPGFEKLSAVVDVAPELANQTSHFSLIPLREAEKTGADAAPQAAAARPATGAPRGARNPAPSPPEPIAKTPAPNPSPAPSPPAVSPDPKPTVRVIDDGPSTTRVIK